MKKKFNLFLYTQAVQKKLIMELKIAFLIILVSVTNVFAENTYSQVAKVSLNVENKPLEQVMDEIENQSEFYFVFNQKQIDVNRNVTIETDNKLITDILPELFNGTDVIYTIWDRKILLTLDPVNNPSSATKSDYEPQQKQVTGVVTDKSDGTPLPGVNVVISGTTSGIITDATGKYKLEVPNASVTLQFSFIGYVTQEVALSGQSTMDVSLAPDVTQLNEVVVTGYGTQKKRNVTGAISSVKSEDLVKTAATSFTQTLEGKVPGLSALQTTGQPGAGPNIKIRSNPSFASSGVLYILDGVPVNDNAGEPSTTLLYGNAGVSRTSLNFINPNDIESIEVLKDAAAASIYGARAGSGVILITTKKGTAGKPRINYDFSYALQEQAKFYEILNTHDYMTERNRILKDMWMRNNHIAPYGNADPSLAPPFVPKFTDQQIASTPEQQSALDAISRSGFINQHNLSLSGGNSGTRYFISGNYLSQQGVLKGSDYIRYNSRVNLDQKIGEKVRLGVNLSTSNSNSNNANVGTEQYENASIIKAAFYYPPNLPLIDENGNYPLNPDYTNTPNPVSYLECTDITVFARLLTSAFAEWNIIKGLKAKANFSYDQSSSKRSAYFPKSFLKGYTAGGDASIAQQNNTSELIEYTLNYDVNFGKNHKLNMLAGYSYQKSKWEGLNAGNYRFFTDQFLYNNLSSGAAPRPTVGSSKSEQVWASYFGRVNYEFMERYLLTAVIRRDGSSIFAQDKKYGLFPSVSAGWIISGEPFFENVSFIPFLKLRASYGTTGNSNIGSNAFAYYSTGYNYVFNNSDNTGVYLSQLNNDNLTWETVKEFNVGIDYQILRGRISGSFDYFNKTVDNLLSFRPLPSNFPVSSIADNVGKTLSLGWEIGIKTRNFVSTTGGFEWDTEFNLSHYKDSWVERSPESLAILPKYEDPNGPFNATYGYVSDGIYTSDRTAPEWMPGILPGTIIIKDLNGYDTNGNLTGQPDGRINTADMVLHGINDPKLTFGITSTNRFKNFDLSIYFYGITGIKYNYDLITAFAVETQLAQFGWNGMVEEKKRWSYDNQTSKFPSGLSTGYDDYASTSDFWKEDGSFLRCKDITLGYTLPSDVVQKQKVLSGLRVSLSVQNAFVITNYSGIDPELTSWVTYPNPRSIIFGLQASF